MKRLACIVLLIATETVLHGAEIRLRSSFRPTSTIVRLTDVAELSGLPEDVAALETITLGPASRWSRVGVIPARHVQDALAEAGVDLLAHRITGASQVQWQAPAKTETLAAKEWVSGGLKRRANDAVASAIARTCQRDGETWLAEVELDDATAQAVATAHYQVQIRPLDSVGEGRQTFELVSGTSAPRRVEAQLRRAADVVTALRPIAKGAVIQASDVVVQPSAEPSPPDALRRVDDVVGRVAAQQIPAALPLRSSFVQTPRVVQRGDVVTVTARSQGLRVRTHARAIEEGGLGDVIEVESVLNRQRFLARVTGLQEVDVYARAIESRSTETPEPFTTEGR